MAAKNNFSGWTHVSLADVQRYMKQSGVSWAGLARQLKTARSTVQRWKQRAPSERYQLELKAMILEREQKDPRRLNDDRRLAAAATRSDKRAAKQKKTPKRPLDPAVKYTSHATFKAPVEITEVKSKRYERDGGSGAWQVTELPAATAERMAAAIKETQIVVSTCLDLPPQKTPAALLGKDGRVAEGAFTLVAPALKAVREIAVAYIQAHGSKADPKVVAWLTAEILSAVLGEKK